MATAITRNAKHFRSFYRRLYIHTISQCRSTNLSTPVNDILQHRTLPLIQPLFPFALGSEPLAVSQRCFYSTGTTATSAESENPVSKSSANTNSDGGEKSGDSHQSKSEDGKPVRGGPVSWLSFLLLVMTGAGIIFYYDKQKKKHIEEINNASQAVKQGPSAGKAAIGGSFNLVNHEGKNVTDKDFIGNWTLLYFGFTHCPDICPDELQKLASAIDKIKQKANMEIVPVFISVDPERDTVEQVREYVKEFHPKLIGLTGTPEEIKKVARAYRVYYMKTTEEDSDYLVDHSIVMYLMSPQMEFVKFFGKNNDIDSLADGIIKEIKEYKKR